MGVGCRYHKSYSSHGPCPDLHYKYTQVASSFISYLIPHSLIISDFVIWFLLISICSFLVPSFVSLRTFLCKQSSLPSFSLLFSAPPFTFHTLLTCLMVIINVPWFEISDCQPGGNYPLSPPLPLLSPSPLNPLCWRRPTTSGWAEHWWNKNGEGERKRFKRKK